MTSVNSTRLLCTNSTETSHSDKQITSQSIDQGDPTEPKSQIKLFPAASTTTFGLSPPTHTFFKNTNQFINKQFQFLRNDSSPLPFTHTTLFQLTNKDLKHSQDRLRFKIGALNDLIDVFALSDRRQLLEFMSTQPVFQTQNYIGMSLEDQRALVFAQMREFALNSGFRFKDLLSDPVRWISMMECLSFHGCNLATKASVNFGLFGATLLNLGSEEHILRYADEIQTLKVTGSFCLTELG